MTTALEVVTKAIEDSGLLGCGCCVRSEVWDDDGCPLDDGGYIDHTYESGCIHEQGRVKVLAGQVLAALESRVAYALQAVGPDMFPEGYYRHLARQRLLIEDEDG